MPDLRGEERLTGGVRVRETDPALHRALPTRPVAGGYTTGRHNFGYWSTVIPAAFTFIAATLTPPTP